MKSQLQALVLVEIAKKAEQRNEHPDRNQRGRKGDAEPEVIPTKKCGSHHTNGYENTAKFHIESSSQSHRELHSIQREKDHQRDGGGHHSACQREIPRQ